MSPSDLEEPRETEIRLPPQATSVAEARQLVRELLADVEHDDLVETAVLLVSEVVTNALLHAGTSIELSAAVDGDGLRVGVGDGSLHLPVRRRYSPTSGTGRGLMMLERLVDEWGVDTHRSGKTVWFRLSSDLDRARGTSSQRPTQPPSRQPARNTVAVQLLNVPLLLHAAWREHAESLLRDYLLFSLDDDAVEDPIQRHAEATDAIAILEEHLPTASVSLSSKKLLADATEPLVTAPTVTVPVPRRSVAHFDTLERAIEEALALARSGQVMTPLTQPEVASFRHWVCRQVVDQAMGLPATPWNGGDENGVMTAQALGWDDRVVTQASVPAVAADQSSRIVAVNWALLQMLGYDDAEQLVGRRLVRLIPGRYRQAHVAGFTMHQLTGRDPLLRETVEVPALHRDGHEVMVHITIRAEQLPEGRHVYVAEMPLAR